MSVSVSLVRGIFSNTCTGFIHAQCRAPALCPHTPRSLLVTAPREGLATLSARAHLPSDLPLTVFSLSHKLLPTQKSCHGNEQGARQGLSALQPTQGEHPSSPLGTALLAARAPPTCAPRVSQGLVPALSCMRVNSSKSRLTLMGLQCRQTQVAKLHVSPA